MADELFAGFTPTSPTPPPKPPEETPVSTASSDASSLLNFWASAPAWDTSVSQPVSVATPEKTTEVSPEPVTLPKIETETIQPTPPVVPVPEALLHMISDAESLTPPETVTPPVSTNVSPEEGTSPTPTETPVVTPPVQSNTTTDTTNTPNASPVVDKKNPPVKSSDARLESFIKDDPIYQQMLRTVDAQRLRLSLAVRYALLMFGIFLVFAWIVNNRVIMFGFSEFVWLARIRDGLFGLMAGLFSATLWYGSPVWFHNMLFVMILRLFALVFFVWVLSALYFPIL